MHVRAIFASALAASALALAVTPAPAQAAEAAALHVRYQYYREHVGYIEDQWSFDAAADELADGSLSYVVNPEGAYALGEADAGTHWLVSKSYGGGVADGEAIVTDSCAYDDEAGTLTVPPSLAGADLSFVARLPWEHPAHALYGHYTGGVTKIVSAEARPRRALFAASVIDDILADAEGGALLPGSYYWIPASSITPDRPAPTEWPKMYNRFHATECGWPEYATTIGAYFVAFTEANCPAIFGRLHTTPGRAGWYDSNWVLATCIEAETDNPMTTYIVVPDYYVDPNGERIRGTWIRIDSVEGNTLHCTFRLTIDGPDVGDGGLMSYQDVMGNFDLTVPFGYLDFHKRLSAGEA